MNKWKPE